MYVCTSSGTVYLFDFFNVAANICICTRQFKPKKMVRRRKTLPEIYKPYLCKLMAFIDGADQAYPQTIEFSEEELLTISPSHISQWM